jgi:hypothetical protein
MRRPQVQRQTHSPSSCWTLQSGLPLFGTTDTTASDSCYALKSMAARAGNYCLPAHNHRSHRNRNPQRAPQPRLSRQRLSVCSCDPGRRNHDSRELKSLNLLPRQQSAGPFGRVRGSVTSVLRLSICRNRGLILGWIVKRQL